MNRTPHYDSYVKILEEELIPAMGCTEPIAIALAAAKARKVLGAPPERVELEVSGNIIKNVKSVTVPNTGGLKGMEAAVAAGIVAGRGFIALAAVIFGRWSAGGVLLACLFFGFCDALQIRLQVSGIAIPYQFFQMIPYVATVIVLSVIGTKQAGPKANGQPYRKEQR